MILEIETPLWERIEHFPPGEGWENDDVTGRIVYPTTDDKRRYLWPMIVTDASDRRTLFVFGPHFTPTVYFHLTQRDCDKLRWALMTRRDKKLGGAIVVSWCMMLVANIALIVAFLRR